jgi:catechol 2,3-dioxygenase-like lactoylglutathione lyase family enzyme
MTVSALQAGAYLHHLRISSPEPERLAAFYARVMDMTATQSADGSWVVRGPGRRLEVILGQAKALGHAGFAVRDAESLAGLKERLRKESLSVTAFPSRFFREGAFSVDDPDANVIAFGLAAHEDQIEPGLRGPLQHLTLATRDVQAIEDFYCGKLGFGVSDRIRNAEGKLMTSFMRGNHEHHNLACFFQERQGMDHHSYEAGEWDTIRDWADRLATRNIQLMWGPGRHGPGNNLFVFIEDPDGNWIEISAEIEVVHDRPTKEWAHGERALNLWGPAIMRA